MTNLAQFKTDDGVEIYIDTQTGESFCSIKGYARMSGKALSTISERFSRFKGVRENEGKIVQVQTLGGIQGVRLVSEDTFGDWIVDDNPQIAKQILKAGVRVFLHKAAGFRVTSTASASPPPEKLETHWSRRQRLFRERTGRIPAGWWCVFLEINPMVMELERHGYDLPNDGVMDISVGKHWCNYLRSERHIEPNEICRKYPHWYPDRNKPVDANIYPDDLLSLFRRWLAEQYEARHMQSYFEGKRDQRALSAIASFLCLPE